MDSINVVKEIKSYFSKIDMDSYEIFAVVFLNNKIGTKNLRIHVHYIFKQNGISDRRRYQLDVEFESGGDLTGFGRAIIKDIIAENNFIELDGGNALLSFIHPLLLKTTDANISINLLTSGQHQTFTGLVSIEVNSFDGYPIFATASKLNDVFLDCISETKRHSIFEMLREDEIAAKNLLESIEKIKKEIGTDYRLIYEIQE